MNLYTHWVDPISGRRTNIPQAMSTSRLSYSGPVKMELFLQGADVKTTGQSHYNGKPIIYSQLLYRNIFEVIDIIMLSDAMLPSLDYCSPFSSLLRN